MAGDLGRFVAHPLQIYLSVPVRRSERHTPEWMLRYSDFMFAVKIRPSMPQHFRSWQFLFRYACNSAAAASGNTTRIT